MTRLGVTAVLWQDESIPWVVTLAASLVCFSYCCPGCHPERSEGSVALGSEMLSCAQHDKAGRDYGALARGERFPGCHPERSEGSVALGSEMLRGVYTERSECAQHDRAVRLRLMRIKGR